MDNAGDVTQQGEQDVEPKVAPAPALDEHGERGQQDRQAAPTDGTGRSASQLPSPATRGHHLAWQACGWSPPSLTGAARFCRGKRGRGAAYMIRQMSAGVKGMAGRVGGEACFVRRWL